MFFYLLISGYPGSSCYAWAFSSCSKQGLLSRCSVGFSLRWLLLLSSMGSRHARFSSWGSQASLPLSMWNLPVPGVPCIGRWILNHWTTREVLFLLMSCSSSTKKKKEGKKKKIKKERSVAPQVTWGHGKKISHRRLRRGLASPGCYYLCDLEQMSSALIFKFYSFFKCTIQWLKVHSHDCTTIIPM